MATASQVSRVLKKKFTRSEELKSSMVRGWSNFTAGFEVRAGSTVEDPIQVHYVHGDYVRHQSTEERTAKRSEQYKAYSEYLTELGFTVKEVQWGTSHRILQVTK
jgi:hypothetical protein